jgi:hypothetical protein
VHRETSGFDLSTTGFFGALSCVLVDDLRSDRNRNLPRRFAHTSRNTMRLANDQCARLDRVRFPFENRSSTFEKKRNERRKEHEISSSQLIPSFALCAIRLHHPAGGVSIPTAKRSAGFADPKIHVSNRHGGDRSNAVDRRGGRVTIRFRSAIS